MLYSEIVLKLARNYIIITLWLHAKLFFIGCPIAWPQWFHQGTHCRLRRKSMLENFPLYLMTYADNHSSILEELLQYRLTKKTIYSVNIIRYSLLLRHTSIQSYLNLYLYVSFIFKFSKRRHKEKVFRDHFHEPSHFWIWLTHSLFKQTCLAI